MVRRPRDASTLTDADDAALLRAVAVHRVDALEHAYDRYAGSLYRLALIVGADDELARCAVSGAFLALWRDPGDLDARRHGLHAALARHICARCAQTTAPEQPRDPPSAPAAYDSLTRLEQRLLALVVFGGHDRQQAARSVGVSQHRAAEALTTALRRLRDAMQATPP